MCRPSGVRVRSSWRRPRQTAAVTIAMIEIFLIATPPMYQGALRYAKSLAVFPYEPNASSAMFWRMNATANVVTSITAGE